MIRLCQGYGVKAFRTKDTGVWCLSKSGEERKIGSIGVHLRRNITAHGVGINIANEVMEYFDRIDACGLGKGVTTLEDIGVVTTREDVETKWVDCLGEELGEETVYKLRDVRDLEENAVDEENEEMEQHYAAIQHRMSLVRPSIDGTRMPSHHNHSNIRPSLFGALEVSYPLFGGWS